MTTTYYYRCSSTQSIDKQFPGKKFSLPLLNIICRLLQTIANKYGPLFRNMFPDSQIAKQYKFHIDLVSKMKTNQYTLATDESYDSDLTKLNPLTVKIFDISFSTVTSNLLDLYVHNKMRYGRI